MTGDEEASVPVQLARMEGTLNLVADRIHGLSGRLDRHEADIAGLKATTGTLAQSAEVARATAVEVATALKTADEVRRVRAERRWSPLAKLITVVLALVSISQAVIQWRM